jgi:glycosyltransferase involved in cell wall biosynthesis
VSGRILHVLPSASAGGAERLAVALAQGLVQQSAARIGFLVPGEGSTADLVRAAGFPLQFFSMQSLMSTARRSSWAEAARVALSARLRGCRRLHVHAPFLYGALAPACRMAGIGTIVHVHLDYGSEQLRWSLRQPPEAVVLCADYLRSQVIAALPEHPSRQPLIVTVRNSIDTARFAPGDRRLARQRVGLPGSGFVLAVIGNLAPHKGQHVAIEVLGELRRRGRDAALWIVGESRDPSDGYREELVALSMRVGCGESVRFLGQRSDVPVLMQAADAVLLPSTNEGMPLVILEAQAIGIPVLAAPTAGVPEIIEHGSSGLLISAGDVEGYVRGVEWLIEHPAQSAAMVATARERVLQSHSSEAYVEQVARVYARVESGRASGRPGVEGWT